LQGFKDVSIADHFAQVMASHIGEQRRFCMHHKQCGAATLQFLLELSNDPGG